MRFTIAVAACVLTVAYGQVQAQQPPDAPQPDVLVQDALDQIAKLQQTIARLKDQLAAAQAAKTIEPSLYNTPSSSGNILPTDISDKDRTLMTQVCRQLGYSATATPVPVTPEPPKPDPKTIDQKPHALVDIPPPSPPPPRLPERRREAGKPATAEDTEAVLERLRQGGPRLPSPPSTMPASNAPREGLTKARDALRDGHPEDARRLLQLVQLQLVFAHDPATQKGAADVAQALIALGTNNAEQTQTNIGHALEQLSASR